MKIKKCETNNAIVAELKNVRKHVNADRLQIATVCGDTIIVGLDAKENDKVIYFDSNLCISLDYLKENNLFSKIELNKVPDPEKKGFFGNRGRVKPTNLRGEKSYGYAASIESVADFCKASVDEFEVGMEFNDINGVNICSKYIPPNTKIPSDGSNNRSKEKIDTVMFPEHWDTKHFKRNAHTIPAGRMIYIEEKLHGTSARIGYSKVTRGLNFFEKILVKFGVKIEKLEWTHLMGSRRVNKTLNKKANAYHDDNMREISFKKFMEHIKKHEQLYYEIVGYETTGRGVQKDFPYGCEVGEHENYLYRITMNGEDGNTYDMSREYVYMRAESIGFKLPHLFEKFHYNGNMEDLIAKVDSYTDGKSMVDGKTLREGVVVWFEDSEGKWTCLKNKSFDFLNYESKAKDAEDFVDIEDIS